MTSVRDLDLFSYRQKTLHWLREDAWNPDGDRLRFERQKNDVRLSTDRLGNVMSLSQVVTGRPCHGIITAFIRYKDAKKLVRGRGWLPSSRCATCPLRESCERLVRERLKAKKPLSAAYDEWLLAEGPMSFDRPGFAESHIGRLWKRVGLAAADANFTSVNDGAVADYYAVIDREALQADRLRKVAERKRDRRAGTLDEGHISDLEIAANNRVMDLVDAILASDTPRELRQVPVKSIEDLGEVWLGRELIRARRQKPRASEIARWILATGRRNDAATSAALCTRVHKDLARIALFEQLKWRGFPLLEAFDPSCESWSEVWLENASVALEIAGRREEAPPLENISD